MAARIVTAVHKVEGEARVAQLWGTDTGQLVIRLTSHLDDACGPTAPLQFTFAAIADLRRILATLPEED